MFSANQMPTQIEEIRNRGMSTQKPLSLPYRLELPHPSLPDPGRLMRLLSSVIFIQLSAVDRLGD
jgi:hypothetical protein